MPKITVDKNKCISCATCYTVYPKCFKEGAEGKGEVKDHDYQKHGYDKQEIVESCSGEAIAIKD